MGLICYTGGTFDILTVGHIDLFKWCRTLAGNDGKVVVALNSDAFISRYKGKEACMCYSDRKALLEALHGLVDEVIENVGNEDSKISIMQVKPDIIVVGSDWLRKDYCKQMSFTPEWLEENRIALAYIPRYLDISSSKVKSRCQS